ncbi:MAG: hypothetical protein V4603_02335 [Pseudomonadota bacterium]
MSYVRHINLFLVATVLALLGACATPIDPPDQRATKIDLLARDILQLSPNIEQEEAYRFAKVAVEAAAGLGTKYEVTLAPWLHNASIITGLKDRGLCYEYARDLYESLKHVDNEHLSMHFVKANQGKLNEHHALAVTVKGATWDTGVLLDAWRGGGNLYFMPIKSDKKYPWLLENRDASFASASNRFVQ